MESEGAQTIGEYAAQFEEMQQVGFITKGGKLDEESMMFATEEVQANVRRVLNSKVILDITRKKLGVNTADDSVKGRLEGDAAAQFHTRTHHRSFDEDILGSVDEKTALHIAFHELAHTMHYTRRRVAEVIGDTGIEEALTEWQAAQWSKQNPIAYGAERRRAGALLGNKKQEAIDEYTRGNAELINRIIQQKQGQQWSTAA